MSDLKSYSLQCVHKHNGLRFTNKVDYAIVMILRLAKTTKSSIKDIAAENKIPAPFLQKIAQDLQKSGIIESARGKFGGYFLKKKLREINVKKLIEILEGPLALARCTQEDNPCAKKYTCPAASGMDKLNNEIIELLGSKSLEYFVK